MHKLNLTDHKYFITVDIIRITLLKELDYAHMLAIKNCTILCNFINKLSQTDARANILGNT